MVSPYCLSFCPLNVFLWILGVPLWPGSLSRISVPFLLSDSAALGRGQVLPTADPLVSLLRLSDPPWLLQNVPHKTSLPEGIRVGTVLRIRGLVPDKAGRFYVNLLCSEEPGSDAALHFNPRLDESTVVFNSLERGAWGAEERGSGIPFQRGQPFDVLLIATEEGFKAVIADSEYHHFRYRIPPGRVRALEVGGDLQLELVKIF
uniref:Galectin n=1 Tax=Moschus moschiferus TaxID=68415 RepID=A0A8C6CMJ0_MOSMO